LNEIYFQFGIIGMLAYQLVSKCFNMLKHVTINKKIMICIFDSLL